MGASDSAIDTLEVSVLGTFRFWVQGTALPAVLGGSQRLLALLSLARPRTHARERRRHVVARVD